MDTYDRTLVPPPFGLANTGTICYLNSYLQMLAGCSSFTRAVLRNEGYLGRTGTGRAVLDFVRAYCPPVQGAGGVPQPRLAADIPAHSARILGALARDLAARRPGVQFGGGQESASELFIFLLDMMEPPEAAEATEGLRPGEGPPAKAPGHLVASVESPITSLFLHRFRCDLHCRQCRGVVSSETDHAVIFNLFHLDQMRVPPATVADFSKAIRLQVSETDGYHCPTCRAPTKAFRVYTLTMVPEVVICAFNLYTGYGGSRRARYFPESVEFPAVGGGSLAFRLVGQVEHAGSLGGGHYWARGLRADNASCERVYLLNDTGMTPSTFGPSPNTYLLLYHFVGRTAPAGEAPTDAA